MKNIRVGVICFLFSCNTFFEKDKIIAKNGVLDLRTWNWQKDGTIDLSGNWEFYWKKFYTPSFFKDSSSQYKKDYAVVPDFWNKDIRDKNASAGFGYATYRLKILCPSAKENLAIKFSTVGSAYKLFVN
ncbi:MAG: hypothetical protein ACR2FN_03005 [Chitinophagaceae bacterium]